MNKSGFNPHFIYFHSSPLSSSFLLFPSHVFSISPISILCLSFSFYCTVFLLLIHSCFLADHYKFCHPFTYSLSFTHFLTFLNRSSSYAWFPEITFLYSSFLFSALLSFCGTLLFRLPWPNSNLCVGGVGVGEGTSDTTPSYSLGTSRVSKNSTPFWHHLPKDSIRLHRLRA